MEGWKPYADQVIAAIQEYSPEAWRAMVEYKSTESVIGASACLGFGSLAVVTAVLSGLMSWRMYREDHHKSWEVPMAIAIITGILSLILIPFGVQFLPSAINPEGAVLLDVLRKL